MTFGRTSDERTDLPLLEERELGEWPQTDTPDVGERYVVEQLLGTQPNLAHSEPATKPAKIEKPAIIEAPKVESFDDEVLAVIARYWKVDEKSKIKNRQNAWAGVSAWLGPKAKKERIDRARELIASYA